MKRIRIGPAGGWKPIGVQDLWAHRELLYFLAWRDVRVRYKQATLGVAWAVLQPVFTMLMFTLLFGRFGGFNAHTGGIAYMEFALSGLTLWLFLANAVTAASNSLVSNANLIGKVYFPRLIVPLAAVAAGLVDLAISLALLAILLASSGQRPHASLLLAPLPLALMVVLACGVGLWIAAINVRFRDVRHVVPFAVQMWLFASPVIYPLSIVEQPWRGLLLANPATGIIEAFRACLFGTPLDLAAFTAAGGSAVFIFVAGVYWFRRVEDRFVDFV